MHAVEHIDLPAKLLGYFLQSGKRNINRKDGVLGWPGSKKKFRILVPD